MSDRSGSTGPLTDRFPVFCSDFRYWPEAAFDPLRPHEFLPDPQQALDRLWLMNPDIGSVSVLWRTPRGVG
jgi:hypothetical protein